MEMFTILPSYTQNFFSLPHFIFPGLSSHLSFFPAIFVVEISSIIFKGSITLSFPLSPHISQSLFPEAFLPGCSLGMLLWTDCHPITFTTVVRATDSWTPCQSLSWSHLRSTSSSNCLRKGPREGNFLDLPV